MGNKEIPKPPLSHHLWHIHTHPSSLSRNQSKADVAVRFASCSSLQRAAGRSPRSTSVGSLKPIAPRPAPSSTGGCDGRSSGAAAAAAGIRRASHSPPTGDHRPRSTISASPPPPPPQSQLYQPQPQAQGHGHGLLPATPGDSPLYLPGAAAAYPPSPTYCTIGDGMPGALSMVNPLDFESGVSFADSAAAIYALEDLDVSSLPAEVFQGDWSWLADEAALREAV
ncbi:hypothetical protein BP00DRAFT_77093 [Aspergillus indologenus CBS 114.80]|uniref:Uncharacterized protein n=1 Tax=Aspergillus indologenus CBS 114.80 TaxID=1450541 RepID=A0A2V5IZM2_9EURO|nr:hypothetical protein BP00DRAFT_77093 [Aspergillus indologenus CBS 114.80]